MGFSLQQFSALFKIRDAAGQPYVLIGGQAVNYWAERYLCENIPCRMALIGLGHRYAGGYAVVTN